MPRDGCSTSERGARTAIPDAATPDDRAHRATDRKISRGIFYLVLAVYVLTSPGRIDAIDGQVRYEVAFHWLSEGRPVLTDPLVVRWFGVRGLEGRFYSFYGAAASVVSIPLVLPGAVSHAPPGEASRFFFSLTSALLGAL